MNVVAVWGWKRLSILSLQCAICCALSASVCRADEFPEWAGPNILADVPIVRECEHVIVDIKCFDGVHKFILDTGATHTIIDASLRAKLGASLGAAALENALAELRGQVFLTPKLLLGEEYQLKSKYAACVDLRLLSQGIGYQLGGVIGLDALERCVVEFDQAEGRVRLFQAVPGDVVRYSECLKMSHDAQGWWVSARLPDGSTERFELDTGATTPIKLPDDVFRRLRVTNQIDDCRERGLFTIAGGAAKQIGGRLQEFRLGPFKHEGVRAVNYPFGQIGMGYLRRYKAVFDFTGRRLYLRPSSEFDAPERAADMSGLFLVLRDGRLLVNEVWDNSPAKGAGLQEGDRILRVNDRSTAELSLFKARMLLTRAGESVHIDASRGEETLSFKFALRAYEKLAPPVDTHEN